jgi:hypothetical protein
MKSYLSRLMLLTAGAVAATAVVAAPVRAADADWTQWRGPAFNGTSPAKNLPAEFGKDKNVLWTAKLPGRATTRRSSSATACSRPRSTAAAR